MSRPFAPAVFPVLALVAGVVSFGLAPVVRDAGASAPASYFGAPAPLAPITVAELGRLLFWDPILSGTMDVACATCHHPDFSYADGRALSLGVGSVGLGPERIDLTGGNVPPTRRNSQSVLNSAYNGLGGGRGSSIANVGVVRAGMGKDPEEAPMFWDSRVLSLETQALEPLKVREEMRGDAFPEEVAVDSVVARLRAIPEYVTLFEEAFGGPEANETSPVTPDRLARAIADFERSLVALDSPFDRYQAGDRSALSPQQVRGLQAFDRANCTFCHNGPLLSDFTLRAEGVSEPPDFAEPDTGDGRFQFRTPSLRNVAMTAPYMHNGTIETLEDVLVFYDRRRSENPHVSDQPRRASDIAGGGPAASLDWDFRFLNDLTEGDMADIVAFFDALTDEGFDRVIPDRVPSGLAPGGALAVGEAP